MARIPIYQIDAFTSEVFAGNPAAVCSLEAWLPEPLMQAVAAENNLAETAFFVPEEDDYRLRWFTPRCEVKLCGHGTLAAALVIFTELGHAGSRVRFETASGSLFVARDPAAADRLVMDFPSWLLAPVTAPPAALLESLAVEPAEILAPPSADNFFVVLSSEAAVRSVQPDFELLASLHPAGVAVTGPGEQSDCASRYFAPSYGIPEDPGTGSIHCGLTPYWAQRLGKAQIHARQVSERGAELFCEDRGDRVSIAGHAVCYLSGHIHL
jgi:PhzF family phenazine biosynthesis protein